MMEFLTQGEAAAEMVGPPVDDGAEYIRQALKNGWTNPALLPDEGRTVYLLTPGYVVVKGWVSLRFLGRATWWTWDPRFAFVTPTAPGFPPRILPTTVAPLAWCEITDPADRESEA